MREHRLLNLKRNEWGDQVMVVDHDMRTWKAPQKADILVSELLGSFGDNELSPECLDGAQSFLNGMYALALSGSFDWLLIRWWWWWVDLLQPL
jgi:hypothetical protein